MKRVVVTGLGIVSSIGNNKAEVTDSLKQGKSGIVFADVYQEMGFRSHVHGAINIDQDEFIGLFPGSIGALLHEHGYFLSVSVE